MNNANEINVRLDFKTLRDIVDFQTNKFGRGKIVKKPKFLHLKVGNLAF